MKRKTCAVCGQEFTARDECRTRSRKYCSRECGWADQKAKAAAQRRPREEVAALVEANATDAELGERYGKSEWWGTQLRAFYGFPRHKRKGDQHGRTGREVQCETCGKTFYAKASEIGRGRKYCSMACRQVKLSPEVYKRNADRMSVERRGKNNPAYKHGKDGNRPRNGTFGLKLKGEKHCRNCGTTQNLGLHHVLPRSFYRAGRDELLNGIPLCTHCHLGWHRRYVTIYRDVFKPEEWAYLTAVKLTGQEVLPWLDERYPVRPEAEAA